MKKFKSKARDLHVMKARSTSQSSCGLGSLGQRQGNVEFPRLQRVDRLTTGLDQRKQKQRMAQQMPETQLVILEEKQTELEKTNSLMGKITAFHNPQIRNLPVKAFFLLTRYIKSYKFINIQKFNVLLKSVKHPLVIAPDSEACVPRTASRTEFECLAANFQSLKGLRT